MRQSVEIGLLLATLTAMLACHPGPVGGGRKQSVGGTISGIVSATGGTVAITGRKITVTEVMTNARYEATTAANGGYTIQVPEGTYRIDVELRAGETLQTRPGDTRINNSDLDPGRDFVITAGR
jgi:hypothetical protein